MSAVVWPGEGFKDNTAYIEIGAEDGALLAHLRSPETQEALRWAARYCRHAADLMSDSGWEGLRDVDKAEWWERLAAALSGLLVEPVEEEET